MRSCLLALLLFACSEDPEPTPMLTPEPSSDEDETTSNSTESEEADEVEAPAPDDRPTAQADDGEPSYFIDTELRSDPQIEHPDPHVRRVLRGLVSNLGMFAAREAARNAPDYTEEEILELDAGSDGSCGLHLLHEHLVTISCQDQNYARSDLSTRSYSFHFLVTGSEIRAFDPLDAFEPREELGARMRAVCEADFAELEEPTQGMCETFDIRLGSDGVSAAIAVADVTGDNLPSDFEIPYEDLAEIIPEDGVLMRLFADTEPEGPPPVASSDADAMAVSRRDLSFHLIAQWQTLDPDVAHQVGLRRWEHGLAQLVYLGAEDATARAIATRLGASPVPVELEDPVRALAPSWMKNRTELNLRERPEGSIFAVLPAGTILLPTDASDRARYIEVETPIGSGYVGRNVLRAHSGCVPRAPDGFDSNAQPLTAIVRLRRAGGSSDGVLFAQSADAHVRVALHDLSLSSCEVGAERARVEAEGHVRDVRLTTTTASGGVTIVVVGTSTDAGASYVAQLVDAPTPIWTQDVAVDDEGHSGVRLGETVDGTHFPISFRVGRDLTRLAWTGSALEERAPD